MGDNVLNLGNDEYVYFNDTSDFLRNIKRDVINNLNREKNIMQSLEVLKTSLQIKKIIVAI